MNAAGLDPAGVWTPASLPPAFSAEDLLAAIPRVRESVHVVREGERGRIGVGLQGDVRFGSLNGDGGYRWLAMLPPLYPEWLGDRSFLETHQVRFPYVAGAMANGIATARLVIAMARARMLAFFGAAGLPIERVAEAIDEIEAALGPDASWGSNLIHSPNDPQLEDAIVDLYLRRGVRRVSASAYMQLTPAIVRYAASGLSIDGSGNVQRRNHVFAKISRPEVARRFLSPPPAEILRSLVDSGRLTAEEARLAAGLPIAEDVTVEADSGGHTDNQSLSALFPTILGLRDELAARHQYLRPIRVGAAGGLGTPAAVAAAFALGAAFVLTGSVNQSAVESGLSDAGKKLLAVAEISDVMMAPRPTCSSSGSRCRCCGGGRCSECARGVCTSSTAATIRSKRCRRKYAASSKARFFSPPAATSGLRPGATSGLSTRLRSSAPSVSPNTGWPWSSAGISASPAVGRSRAIPSIESTTRSGADPRWEPSTPGWPARPLFF